MRLYTRMEQAAQSEDEKKALNLLRDSSLKESFVRGVREQWVKSPGGGGTHVIW